MPFLPFIPFANCMEVVFMGALGGQNAFMTMGLRHSSGITDAVIIDTNALIDTWYQNPAPSGLRVRLSNQYALAQRKFTDLTTETGVTLTFTQSSPQEGGVAGASVPNNVALVVSLYTRLRGRSYRGRIFVPGVPAAGLVTSSLWNTTETDAIEDSFASLQAILSTDSTEIVVLSRFNNGVRRTVGVATPVGNIVAKEAVGTQRRRVVGHGS